MWHQPSRCNILMTILITAVFGCGVFFYYVSRQQLATTNTAVLQAREQLVTSNTAVLQAQPNNLQMRGKEINYSLILFWTTFFDTKFSHYLTAPDCLELHSCKLVTDKRLANVSHAIVFNRQDFDPEEVPEQRHSWQRYVYFNMESALTLWRSVRRNNVLFTLSNNIDEPKNFFNWTMTTLRTSDVHLPYGSTKLTGTRKYIDFKMLLYNTTRKPFAWVVSNCNAKSKREQIVERIQRANLTVEIYGKCYKSIECPREEHVKCLDRIANNYWFYLAFENSVCVDYITEKFWNSLKRNIVPVVLKRNLYLNVAPPKSFIALDDYATIEHFTAHIHFLMSNLTAYAQYLEWKNLGYELETISDNHPHFYLHKTFCDLCDLTRNKALPAKSYDYAETWFINNSKCEPNHVDQLWVT